MADIPDALLQDYKTESKSAGIEEQKLMGQFEEQKGAEIARDSLARQNQAGRESEIAPLIQDYEKKSNTPVVPPQPVPKPDPPSPNQYFNKTLFRSLAGIGTAIALIASAKSRGAYVPSAMYGLTGAMQGIIQGRQENMYMGLQHYHDQMQKAIQEENTRLGTYQSELENKKLSLTEALQNVKLHAMKYDDKLTMWELENKHGENMMKIIENQMKVLEQHRQALDRTQQMITMGILNNQVKKEIAGESDQTKKDIAGGKKDDVKTKEKLDTINKQLTEEEKRLTALEKTPANARPGEIDKVRNRIKELQNEQEKLKAGLSPDEGIGNGGISRSDFDKWRQGKTAGATGSF